MPNPKSGVRRAETVFNQRNIMGKAGSGGKVQVSLDSWKGGACVYSKLDWTRCQQCLSVRFWGGRQLEVLLSSGATLPGAQILTKARLNTQIYSWLLSLMSHIQLTIKCCWLYFQNTYRLWPLSPLPLTTNIPTQWESLLAHLSAFAFASFMPWFIFIIHLL